jgi:hypothetical protein
MSSAVGIDIRKVSHPSWYENVMEHLKESQRALQTLDIHGTLALAGAMGPVILVAMDLAAAISQPKYSLVRDTISSLALTSMGWIQTIGFLAIGLLIEIFTAGLFLNIHTKKRGFGFGIFLLAFFGFGLLLIGAFHTDPAGTPATVNGIIHLAATYSVLGLFPIALALLLPSIKGDPDWAGMFPYTVVTAILAVLLAVGCVLIPSFHISWFGLYERITVANAIVWVEVSAIRLLMLSLRRQRQANAPHNISG